MTKCLRVALFLLLAFWIAGVSKGQTPADDADKAGKEAMTPAEEAERANAIARALANPVANLWSLEFQFNNFELTNHRWNYNLNFQPVLPVSLTSCWNLITRPVIQVYDSEPYQTSTGAERARRISATGPSSSCSRRPTRAIGCSAPGRRSSFRRAAPSTRGKGSSRWGRRSSSPT